MGPDPNNTMSPLILGDRLFLTHQGILYCLDSLTGGQYWQVSVKDAHISSAPIAWKDLVIVGVDNGLLLALSPKDGTTVWKTDCGSYIAPTPAVIEGVLVVGCERTVLGLNPATGKTKWASMLTSGVQYGPLYEQGVLYFRCLDGSVQSLDLSNGQFRWRASVPSGPESYTPLVVDRRMLLFEGSQVYAVAHSGMISWTQHLPAGIGGPVALFEDKLYVPCVDGHLYVLNPLSGRMQHIGGLQSRWVGYRASGGDGQADLLGHLQLFGLRARSREPAKCAGYIVAAPREQPVDEPSVFGIYSPLVQ